MMLKVAEKVNYMQMMYRTRLSGVADECALAFGICMFRRAFGRKYCDLCDFVRRLNDDRNYGHVTFTTL